MVEYYTKIEGDLAFQQLVVVDGVFKIREPRLLHDRIVTGYDYRDLSDEENEGLYEAMTEMVNRHKEYERS